ncbi:MAG: efflux RND transporter permease subunit [Arachidicoccus sp.]|nr:efflux RND transporter permease subunit [Arachidicoccus sp.]
MWYSLGKFILKNRLILLIILIAATSFMGYEASKVKMSYDFAKAIPTDNPKYIDYKNFLQQFGQDGSTMVVGIESDKIFTVDIFNKINELQKNLRKTKGVTGVLSLPNAVNLAKDTIAEKFNAANIFHAPYTQQNILDSDAATFKNLPFYKNLLYNPDKNAYLIAVTLDTAIINSKARVGIIKGIVQPIHQFENQAKMSVHISGLPYIRTVVSDKIAHELNWFLIGSFVLSAITLLLFFRSFSSMLMSLLVVGFGVLWSVGTMVLFGYKITLLTALIPPLIVVIGIPNCIYFLNKYHTSYKETNNKNEALANMIGRMGIVTLFCNIAAAIGFAVFAFTSSDLLKEFGVVSGINIMMLFIISLIFIPTVLSYLPAPKTVHMRYLDNKILTKALLKIETWTFNYKKYVYWITVLLMIISIIGIMKIRNESHVVDDLPQSDIIYKDLVWFEQNFNGVMPLEVIVDTKRKNGLFRNLKTIQKIDEFSRYMAKQPDIAKPLSFVEALKFVRQAFYNGDSTYYDLPNDFDLPFMGNYIKNADAKAKDAATSKSALSDMLKSFMDISKQKARISINMKDVGTIKLPSMLKDYRAKADKIFDTAHYNVTFTGSTVTFLEGSIFIINGLKQSIFWAFILIAVAMLYLFRSVRILFCSLIPNIIPLMITAGVMGWTGITLKPSTVLVFSVALGIAIDVTIRFLVNYKQELPLHKNNVDETLRQTIRHTGISIIYTSLVLVAGFVIFCFSEFGGTKNLGWLTSLTLAVAMLTNLVLLPVLIKTLSKKEKKE